MTNLSSLAITDAELDTMAHGLAYDASCSSIDSCCARVDVEGSAEKWYDATPCNVSPAAAEFVAESVAYLEARGLLERHDDNPNWVTLHNESEATR